MFRNLFRKPKKYEKKKQENVEKDSLEREFLFQANAHKYIVIKTALIEYGESGLYNHKLFKELSDYCLFTGEKKADTIAEKLCMKSFDSEEWRNKFNDCYNLCYGLVKDYIEN